MNIHGKVALLASAAFALALVGCSGSQDASTDTGAQANSPQSQTQTTAATAAQGAVQRNYPSSAEEATLKLNYPVFLAYGKDSARITPFYPGAGQQPVSVKLAPNAAGYTLAAEGSQCQFPIDYELKSADGKQLASGEYKGGTTTLDGWGAQTGTAILAVHMADGAKNNFGCNLVVNKK